LGALISGISRADYFLGWGLEFLSQCHYYSFFLLQIQKKFEKNRHISKKLKEGLPHFYTRFKPVAKKI